MPELRKDPIVGRWVIISTDRNQGDASAEERTWVRKHANVVLTNPDGGILTNDTGIGAFLEDYPELGLARHASPHDHASSTTIFPL